MPPVAEFICGGCRNPVLEPDAERCRKDGALLCSPCHGNRSCYDECECGDAGHGSRYPSPTFGGEKAWRFETVHLVKCTSGEFEVLNPRLWQATRIPSDESVLIARAIIAETGRHAPSV